MGTEGEERNESPRASDRWRLRDPDKMPPKNEFPPEMQDLSVEDRRRWWWQYLKWTDSSFMVPPDSELTPEQLRRKEQDLRGWRHWQSTGDNSLLVELGLN